MTALSLTGLAISLTSVTMTAGLLGGYGGYLIEKIRLLDQPSERETNSLRDRAYFRMSLVLGVIAAFTIPTFLQFMALGSNGDTLLAAILNSPTRSVDKWFVYVGLCLLAGYSGQQFVKKLSTELLNDAVKICLLYTSPSPRDKRQSRMPSSA